jgi:RHS repeat-associated protein
VSGTNRLDSSTGGDVASYSYDADGNITDDGTHSYEYNEANRLEMIDEGATAYYSYDGDGRRAVKSTDALTYYFYDPFGRLLTEVRVNDVLNRLEAKDYVYVHGAPVARVDWWMSQGFARPSEENPLPTWSDSLFFYHTDHLGTPFMMTSQSSVPVWQAEQLPFGDLVAGEPSIEDIENNLRFAGQYFDAETALHQNWFRDFDPVSSRYREADPIGIYGRPNLYAYSNSDPTGTVDPFGLREVPDDFVGPLEAQDYRTSEMTPTICGRIPPLPPGVDIEANMKEAREHIFNYYWFYNQVRSNTADQVRLGRSWDYKKLDPVYEDGGNFNFGATGKAFGFSEWFLRRGAGWANLRADPNRGQLGLGHWWWRRPYGDFPEDQDQIDGSFTWCECMRKNR